MQFNEILIKNNLFRTDIKPWHNPIIQTNNINEGLLKQLRDNKYDITEKQYGIISSFNFSRKVFKSGKWTELSKIARGLFINNNTGDIIARGYEKFFNYNEGKFNTDDYLKDNVSYPVAVYRKYNGFLGILGIYEDTLLFCSKSTVGGVYADYFKNIFESEEHNLEYLKRFMKDNHICLIFEVIDYINDPHIVKYDRNKLILLDAIFLEEKFSNMNYETLQRIGKECNFFVKEKIKEIYNYEELNNFIQEEENDMKPQKEGWVLVDKNNYHFKLKCKWYKIWKNLRSLKDKIAHGKSINYSSLTNSLSTYFVNWCHKQDKEYIEKNSIIKLRDDFYEQTDYK